MSEFILHHYDPSPFSEKVRVMFGLKGLAWRSVQTPNMMPKPDLTPLTGGYRKAPVMQIGADIYCDSQVILAEIEARAPKPATVSGPAWGTNFWSDRLFFGATVPVIFGEMGHLTPKAFIADREKLSGRPFDVDGMAKAAPIMKVQWRSMAAWIDQGLAAQPFLAGDAPGLSDVSAYMNIWWLGGALPKTYAELTAGLERLAGWRDRMRALGHGTRTEMTGAEALAVAKAAEPAAPPAHDPADPLKVGQAVVVMADDYGKDPISGTVVAARPDRLTLSRDTPDLGRLNLHFPRVGFIAVPQA